MLKTLEEIRCTVIIKRLDIGRAKTIVKNYWKMRSYSLWTASYAYIDHLDYLADSLFIQEEITVKFENEYGNESDPYCIIFCKVKKKDEERFRRALGKLENKMLLTGHMDYPDVCKKIDELIGKEKKEEAVS